MHDKGKLAERQGRKAKGSTVRGFAHNDSLAAEARASVYRMTKVGSSSRKRLFYFVSTEVIDNMASTPKVAPSSVYGKDITTYPLQALLDSRTVVEKEGYVSTGLLTHVEGEMLEIELSEFKTFDLGDPVHLTLYSPVGIQRLQSTVIAKAEGSLAVLLPPKSLAGLEEKREANRLEVRLDGQLQPIVQTSVAAAAAEDEEEPLAVFKSRNVSLSGIGFETRHNVPIRVGEMLSAVVTMGFELNCRIEIVRREPEGEFCFYGARFVELSELQTRMLRAFLIREQVSTYYRTKEKRKARAQM